MGLLKWKWNGIPIQALHQMGIETLQDKHAKIINIMLKAQLAQKERLLDASVWSSGQQDDIAILARLREKGEAGDTVAYT